MVQLCFVKGQCNFPVCGSRYVFADVARDKHIQAIFPIVHCNAIQFALGTCLHSGSLHSSHNCSAQFLSDLPGSPATRVPCYKHDGYYG